MTPAGCARPASNLSMTMVRAAVCMLVLATPAAAQVALDVPAGTGGWVLYVSTSGGIMGNGTGNFAIASNGGVQCTTQCAASAAEPVMRTLREQVKEASAVSWLQLPANSLCMDCLVTRVSLTLRNEDGTMTVVRASWDPTTRAQLPAAVVRVVDLARSAAQPFTR